MTKTEFHLLALFIKLAHGLVPIKKAQQTLARYLGGKARETICRKVKRLKEWGLVDVRGQLYDVRTYRISAWFLVPAVRILLAKFFPALALNIQQFINKKVTPYRSNSLFINSREVATSKRQPTKKENNLQVVRVSSIKERRGGMKQIGQIFGDEEAEISDNAQLYHQTNPRKTTSYSSQTNQREAGGQDQEFPTRGNRYSSSSDVNAHYAKKIEKTQELTQSFQPKSLTFDEAMAEITILERRIANGEMDLVKNFIGVQLFNENVKAQCDRILSLVDFDKGK